MKKTLSLAFVLLLFLSMRAQDSTAVKNAVDRLAASLVAKDTMAVKQLLHKNLRFGHSNGWVQTKREAMEDLKSGALVYEQFNRQALQIEMLPKSAYVKEWLEVRGNKNGTAFNVKLFVLQHWVKTKKGWQLLTRQGAKLG